MTEKVYFKQKNLLNILFLLSIFVIFLKFFIFIDFYPTHDETVIVIRNTEWHNFLWRNYTSNHTLNSFFAVITKSIFGYNLLYYRFYSFLCFVGILIIFKKLYPNLAFFSLFLIVILTSNILSNYIWIFRGYYVWAFLTVLNFFFLKSFLKNSFDNKNFKLLMLINFLLCCHALFVLYTVIPFLLYLSFIIFKNKDVKKLIIFFVWFLIPLTLFYFIVIVLEGFTIIFWDSLNFKFLQNNLLIIIRDGFIPGFKEIFLNSHLSQYSSDENIFLASFKKLINPPYNMEAEYTILFIYILSIFILLIKTLLKKNNYLDLIFLIMVLFFYLVDKNPEPRQHIGIIYFFIFYITDNLYEFKDKLRFFSKIEILSTVIVVFLVFNIQVNEKFYDTKPHVDKINNLRINNSCNELNNLLNEYEIWLLTGMHDNKCSYYYDFQNKKNILVE